MNAALYRFDHWSSSAETTLAAAEKVRQETSSTDADVEYHLRRAEVFATLALAAATASTR